MKRTAAFAAAGLAALALYLLCWPDGVEPVAWTPPPAPALEGPYAANDRLRGIQKIAEGLGRGPEGINVDAVGRIYAGFDDGRLVQIDRDGAGYVELANTHGRPLGITFGANGGVIVADAKQGLLHYGKRLRRLVKAAEGLALGCTNDVDNTRLDKYVYFTDSTAKFPGWRARRDVFEHGANGRLLRHDVATGETQVLLKGLHFANGVAVGPDDQYVLVAETTEYRVLRYWLKGERAGTHDVFIDNLPGLPDNISYNNRDRFWLAIVRPRDRRLDELLPGSFLLRQVLARLPQFVFPAKRHAFVLGLGLDGKVVANLQYAGSDAYAPISSVREHGPWLLFGSPDYPAVGRIPLNQVVAGAEPPPAGWENVRKAQRVTPARDHEADEAGEPGETGEGLDEDN